MYAATGSVSIKGSSECVALTSASALAFTLGSTGGVISLVSSIGAGSAFCCGAGLSDCRAASSGRFTASRTRSSSCCIRSSARISGGLCKKFINSAIKTALGRFQISSFELLFAALIFLLGVRNQIEDRVGFGCGIGSPVRAQLVLCQVWTEEEVRARERSQGHSPGAQANQPAACRYGSLRWPGLRPRLTGVQSEG